MNFNYLKTFYYFGMIRNYTRTAERLFITQSAVSHALKKLEDSVGEKLIDKKGRDYVLTEYGEMLYNACRDIFFRLESVEEKIKKKDPSEPVSVVLGAPVEFGSTVLVSSMPPFLDKNSNYHIDYIFSHRLFERLLSDELDLMVDCRFHNDPSVKSVFLCDEPYTVVASPEYVKKNGIENVADFNRGRILSMDRDASWWENFFIGLSNDLDLEIGRPVVINHVRGLINGAIHGMGISLVPKYTVRKELKEGTLVEIFKKVRARDDHFRIFVKESRYSLEKIRTLIDYLREVFSNF